MADDRAIRTFGQLVQQLEDGQLVADLGDRMQELNGKLGRHAEATMPPRFPAIVNPRC